MFVRWFVSVRLDFQTRPRHFTLLVVCRVKHIAYNVLGSEKCAKDTVSGCKTTIFYTFSGPEGTSGHKRHRAPSYTKYKKEKRHGRRSRFVPPVGRPLLRVGSWEEGGIKKANLSARHDKSTIPRAIRLIAF